MHTHIRYLYSGSLRISHSFRCSVSNATNVKRKNRRENISHFTAQLTAFPFHFFCASEPVTRDKPGEARTDLSQEKTARTACTYAVLQQFPIRYPSHSRAYVPVPTLRSTCECSCSPSVLPFSIGIQILSLSR
jgi:collagenase-like PrtC family protease